MAFDRTTNAQSLAHDRRQHIRREMDLDRDELFFLLESYRNMVELSTTLLERQEVINKGIEKVLMDTAKIHTNQTDIMTDIDKLPDATAAGIDAALKEVKQELQNNRKAENNEHHGHTLRIYGAYGVLTTIILALIGLILKVWPAP